MKQTEHPLLSNFQHLESEKKLSQFFHKNFSTKQLTFQNFKYHQQYNHILKNIKRNKTIIDTKNNNTIPYKEYIKGFKIQKGQTTTSPSEGHIGHHQALLKPDGNQYLKENPDFCGKMMKPHHTITLIAQSNAIFLNRQLTSIVQLLLKDKGQPKIHHLRIIK